MAPNIPQVPPDPYRAGLEQMQGMIAQNLANGGIQGNGQVSAEQVARQELDNRLEAERLNIVAQAASGAITQEEATRRQREVWRLSMIGVDTTPEATRHAESVLAGELQAKKDPYSILKKDLDPTRPWWMFSESGLIEVPRARVVRWMGGVMLRESTIFVSAKQVYKRSPTAFLETIQREETAQYLLPAERPKNVGEYFFRGGLKPAETLSGFRDRDDIHMVGEGQVNSATQARVAHRKTQIVGRQLLYRKERHGLMSREYGSMAELHDLTETYITGLDNELTTYDRRRNQNMGSFNNAGNQTDRLAAVNLLINTARGSANNIGRSMRDVNNEINRVFTEITTIANASLNNTEQQVVVDAEAMLDAAFTSTPPVAWNPRLFNAREFQRLLPSRSTPYNSERAEIVRAALSEKIRDMAVALAGYGNNAEAKRMLGGFKKMGVLHEYSYDAIKILADNAYMSCMLTVQDGRIIPEGLAGGNQYSYVESGIGNLINPRGATPIPHRRNRNRQAMSVVTEAALTVLIDGKIAQQIVSLRTNPTPPMPNGSRYLRAMAPSVHDKRVAKAYDTYFHYEVDPRAAPENWSRHQIPHTKIKIPMWLERLNRFVRRRP